VYEVEDPVEARVPSPNQKKSQPNSSISKDRSTPTIPVELKMSNQMEQPHIKSPNMRQERSQTNGRKSQYMPVKRGLPPAELEYSLKVHQQDFSSSIDNRLKTRIEWKEGAELAAMILIQTKLELSSLETLLMILYKISVCMSRLMREETELNRWHYYHLGRLMSCLTNGKLTQKSSILWPLLEQMKSVGLVFVSTVSRLTGTEMTAVTRRMSVFFAGLVHLVQSGSGPGEGTRTMCSNLKKVFGKVFAGGWHEPGKSLPRQSNAGNARICLFYLHLVQTVAMLVSEDQEIRSDIIVQLGEIVMNSETTGLGFAEFYMKIRQTHPQWIYVPARV
jgi:hypothetical protein